MTTNATAAPPAPDFRAPAFLRDHIAQTMAFYDAAGACDPSGGFFHFFRDDGTVHDRTTRHLVSSTRFVVTHAMAARRFGRRDWRDAARHGLRFVERVHKDAQSGGYAWLLRWDGRSAAVLDATNHCYGLAFVLLAQAHAALAGIDEARSLIDATFDLMERRFWEPANGLYADEAGADWQLSPYRGQNANMHACEAMLAAFDATGERRFVDRAATLADAVTRRLAAQSPGTIDGGIWEHWRRADDGADGRWVADADYNRDDRTNIFRPWGFQPGHFTEWAKLLLTLDARQPQPWLLPRARRLFDTALARAWDGEHGGLVYGFGPDGAWCDDHKYFWVQAETIAAAARLALRSEGDDAQRCWRWYDRVWAYAWRHLVDHRHGAWYRVLARDNRKLSDEKSPAGKVDYHTMGACHDVLDVLGA